MKKRYTEQQIIESLKKVDSGLSVKELCREMGVSEPTYYHWKKKHQGMEVSDVRKLKSLEEENSRLKRLVANQALDIEMYKEITSRKW
jgi:putative transposase